MRLVPDVRRKEFADGRRRAGCFDRYGCQLVGCSREFGGQHGRAREHAVVQHAFERLVDV